MESLARELSYFSYQLNIEKIIVKNKTATAIVVNGETITDLVLSGADYHHTETLLDKNFAYSEKYWDSRVLLLHLYCSMLVLIKLKTYHIMLCFDVDFYQHAKDL
jgi:phytoene desaturase